MSTRTKLRTMRIVAIGLALAALLTSGCKSENRTAEVSGRVMFQGKPLSGGIVRFHSASDDRSGFATIHPDGTYALSSAPVGKVKISVDTAHLRRHRNVHLPIPEKYRSFKTTDLTYKVQPGSQSHDLLLE